MNCLDNILHFFTLIHVSQIIIMSINNHNLSAPDRRCLLNHSLWGILLEKAFRS